MDQATQYSMIDKYVLIDQEIKRLEKRRDELKQQVIALGEGGHPGHEGAVSVSLQQRKTLDQDKIKKLLSEDVLETCYKTSASIVVRVTKFEKETSV